MNFEYLKRLNKKIYTTFKRSIIISGPSGTGKTSYLKWHSFRCQYERAQAAGVTLKEQIKKEGYISFYVNLSEDIKREERLALQERTIIERKYQIDYTEEKEVFIGMHYYRNLLVNELHDFFSIIERENDIDKMLQAQCEQEIRPIDETEYIFEDPMTGDLMRTFLTQYMPERMLNLMTNLGQLLKDLLELYDEKIIFAIDCIDYLSGDLGEQKLIGYFIRQCSKSKCKNITIRCACAHGCEDMEMLYPYISCKSDYKEICLLEKIENPKNRDIFVKHMKNVVDGYFSDTVKFPDEFVFYAYPDIGQLLRMIEEWKAFGFSDDALYDYLQQKSRGYLASIKDEEQILFIKSAGALLKEQWNKGNKRYCFQHVPKKWSWKKKFRDLQYKGIVREMDRWVYAFHPFVYPIFGIYLEEYLEAKVREEIVQIEE